MHRITVPVGSGYAVRFEYVAWHHRRHAHVVERGEAWAPVGGRPFLHLDLRRWPVHQSADHAFDEKRTSNRPFHLVALGSPVALGDLRRTRCRARIPASNSCGRSSLGHRLRGRVVSMPRLRLDDAWRLSHDSRHKQRVATFATPRLSSTIATPLLAMMICVGCRLCVAFHVEDLQHLA